ncbi:hypothetical protein [Leisingera sp. ANG-Vp]|uniref:hypothetical protein n=1 Tax=Leisingera sp. ANG-Vp TaxID=1577896 RepID=UPI001269EB5C|nr:hypothetical protein [Leisingera sp. ANG-Vp]
MKTWIIPGRQFFSASFYGMAVRIRQTSNIQIGRIRNMGKFRKHCACSNRRRLPFTQPSKFGNTARQRFRWRKKQSFPVEICWGTPGEAVDALFHEDMPERNAFPNVLRLA